MVDFTSAVEQSSQGPVSGRIAVSARKWVKRKLDNKSLETKYEVLMEVKKEKRSPTTMDLHRAPYLRG